MQIDGLELSTEISQVKKIIQKSYSILFSKNSTFFATLRDISDYAILYLQPNPCGL